MTSNNPFKKALGWIVALSFFIRLLDVTKYTSKKPLSHHEKLNKKNFIKIKYLYIIYNEL